MVGVSNAVGVGVVFRGPSVTAGDTNYIPPGYGKKTFTATVNGQNNFTFSVADTPFTPRLVVVSGIVIQAFTYNTSTNTLTLTDGVFSGAEVTLIQ